MRKSQRKSETKISASTNQGPPHPGRDAKDVASPVLDTYARHADDTSIERQIASCRIYAESFGARVHEEHRDSGGAASMSGRGGLAKLLQNIRSGLIDGFVVEDLDRLSRDAADLHAIVRLCCENGVELHSVAGGKIDLPSATFKGFMSDAARAKIALRASLGRRAAAEGGRGSARPFGYAADPALRGERCIHPERAAAVKVLYEMCADGTRPVELARWMSERHPTPADCSRIDRGASPAVERESWTPAMVTALIRSRYYTGALVHSTSRASSGHAIVAKRDDLRIVGDDLWLRAQSLLGARRAKDRGKAT